METLVKERIASVFSSVNKVEKINPHVPTEDELINSFLDSINALKKELKKHTKQLDNINENLEVLSWATVAPHSKETIDQIIPLFTKINEVHKVLIKKYLRFDALRKKGILKEELKAFKGAIDDLKEICSDLKDVYLNLPSNEEFKATTKSLSQL